MAPTQKGLVDMYGRAISARSLKTEQAGAELRAVRRNDTFHPASGLTPQRLACILRDSIDGDPEPYLALAEDMEERNEHYAGVLGTRKRQVAGLEITVEAASDAAADAAAADLIREVTERDRFRDELIDILDAVGKGFSATEILWDTSEGQWRPKAFKWRDPRWFRFDRDDPERLLLRGVQSDEPLKPFGWIVHTAKAKSGLPIRGGLARGAAWSFLFKAFTLKDWAIFSESYGQPLRLGKFGPGATEDDKQKLMQAVAGIASDYAAIVPETMAIDFIEAKLTGSLDLYERRSDWLDRQISKLVLGQTGTTDAIAGGHAVGKVHDEVRADIEEADARQLAASLNRDLVRPLIDLNLGPQKAYPVIRIGRPDEVDVSELVENVAKLVPLGLKVGMSTIRDHLGLPDPDPDEEVLGAPVKENPEPPSASAPQAKAEPLRAQAFRAGPVAASADAVDRAVDALLDEGWERLVGPIVDGLDDEIGAAETLAEARDILTRRAEVMGLEAFTATLAQAVFAARLAGEADEDLR
ncbi:DUF935 domain-containing protein [Labrenzia sp. R4_2]|uniref:DUF935 domain-containing protein n=1 Tax=Labrenzia sp. R4_2 TaxID=2821107 RepID=UPI001ADA26AA|nr:DUF935 domain-containing protein [Labrenzia sp. R4_2]MBO9419165.1 DUF935 domain-containing protein [Labrenzia sp. R4_2]